MAGLSGSRLEIIQHALGRPNEDVLKDIKPTSSKPAVRALQEHLSGSGRHDDAARVRLADVVADAVNDHVKLASQILDNVSSTRDVAIHYGAGRIMSLVAAETSPASRTAISSLGADSAAKSFAMSFRQRMFDVEPTAVLQQMLSDDDPQDDLPIHQSKQVRGEVAMFLARRPTFNIRTTSVLAALQDDEADTAGMNKRTRTAVTESLKLLQRVQALTPAPEALKPLLEEGLTSAMRVSSVPRKRFVSRMAPQLSTSGASTARAESLAGKIHDHAMASRLRADNALVQMHQMVKGTGLRAVDGESTLSDRQLTLKRMMGDASGSPESVDLDALFGDMDMCECEACLDVTSPTAYYVDLLQYLRNNNLDTGSAWENTGKEGIAHTALEKLFQRRPDLQHLQLTCANANTVLPMIDLANETMEAFVIHSAEFAGSGKAVIETWNIGTETTDELLASPSHTRKKAYCILYEAVYPIASLPYFQPLDASRLYLGYLGTSRYELIDTFRLAQRQWPVRSALVSTPEKMARYGELRAQMQDRASAAEYLGLSPGEYVIITKQSLWPIECSEFANDGIIDADTYRKDIGVRDAFAYWGYTDESSLLDTDASRKTGLSFVKAQFLSRSGLSYAETADLIRTKFVNPMMPSGKDKVLLDSIRFSYRFLQQLTVGVTDTSQRNQLLALFISNSQPWVHNILLLQIPPTGNPLIKPVIDTPTFSESEVSAWVSKWFDCIGKLAVLEAGQGPRLPVQGYLLWAPPARESLARSISSALSSPTASQKKILGYLDNTGELRDDNGDLVGFVWMNGQVYYGGLRPIRSVYPAGSIMMLQIPKQTPTPTPDKLPTIPSTEMPVRVDKDSRLVYVDQEPPNVVWSMPPDTCTIENTKLVHLSGSPLELWEWDRINRFIRLYRKLQSSSWTISELDAALIGLGKVPETPLSSDSGSTTSPGSHGTPTSPSTGMDDDTGFSFSNFQDKGCGCGDDGAEDSDGDCDDDNSKSPCDPSNFMDISPGFLRELVSIQRLVKLTGQDQEQLMCLRSDIGTFGHDSLYARLFLTHDLEAMDDVFMADDNGNYLTVQPKIGDHVPVIVAALRLKASYFDAVLQRVGLTREDIISVQSLTKLYRHVVLSRILGIKPDALLNALDLYPNPYASASATLDMYLLWSRMSAASFTVQQLRYITGNLDDPLRPIAPAKVAVLRTAQTIMDGLLSIETSQPDLTAQEEAILTAAQVKAKAALVLGPSVVESVIGLIEGTLPFTTNAPIGLVIDATKLSPKIIYKDPLTPPSRRATLTIVGSLTETETSAALALFPNNGGWSSSLQRAQKQAQNLVKNELKDVFADMPEAIQVLTQGDVPAAQPTSDSDLGTPGTAMIKRAFFMKKFMPFLRKYLSTAFIITTMSGMASVSADTCAWLLKNVLKTGPISSQTSAMDVLLGLKSSKTNDASAAWTGYLIPPSTDVYVFYGYGDERPLPLTLGGVSIPFTTQNEDPSNLWWTAEVPLIGGKVINFQVQGQAVPGDLQWKTARSGIVPIPPGALLPDASLNDASGVFAPLLKASMVIQGFSLGLTELQYLQDHGDNFAALDFNAITFEGWKRLLGYYEMRNSLVSREKSLIDLFKWASLRDSATADDVSKFVSSVTAWDATTVKTLLDKKNFDLEKVAHFRDEVALSKLAKVFSFIQSVGITDVELLLSWTDLKLGFNPTWKLAKSIRQTIRGRYSASDYEQAIKPTHDQIRKNQRDALIAYLLVLPAIRQWGVTDADGLFEFFLLDVQMGSCMQTSRTKQAISSVQLFVQRCMLGLEERYGIANDALDAQRWHWMSKQTVWTANRKVFLWPENWMISSLRDDKTPIYAEMESEMLQRDVSPANVVESFKTYVDKLDQIAHLRAVGMHVEKTDTDKYVLHCVAMTIGSPYLFFYRSYNFFTREWTPWIRISVEIPTYTIEYSTQVITLRAAPISTTSTAISAPPADNLLPIDSAPAEPVAAGSATASPAPATISAPVVSTVASTAALATSTGGRKPVDSFTGCYVVPVAWESRKLLFIGEITQKAVPNTTAMNQSFGDLTKPNSTTTANSISPPSVWEVKLSWTEYRSGKWTQKQVASEPFQTKQFANDFNAPPVDSFQFVPQITKNSDGGEFISIEIWRSESNVPYFEGNYVFNGTVIQKGDLQIQDTPTNWISTSFHLVGGRSAYFTTSSLQKSEDGAMKYLNAIPHVAYTSKDPNGIITYLDSTTDVFYHPFSSRLTSAASISTDNSGIEPIENVYRSLSTTLIDPAFGTGPSVKGADGASYPTFQELSKPYTNYNWELGFFGPIEVANALMSSQQFDQALAMLHFVFNPYADGPDASRVWQWYPFKTTSSQQVLETVLNQLKPHQFDLNITQWRDKPFQPFVVARGRIVAYMKWTVMLYIKTLIAYGDMYFRRRSLEDIPLAIQIYVLASHLYGPAGEKIPKRGKKIPQTYFSLLDKWDAFSNAVVQLEIAFPYSNQTQFPWGTTDGSDAASATDAKQIALANVFGFATSSYFCLPSNPELRTLRDTIDQRLYNIRNCRDIDGRPMPLALWDAPIDPGQLVAAVASGLSLSSALNDLNASLPNYRFTWLIARALEMTGELKSLESTFLSIKEKQDSEKLQLLRSGHEIIMNKMVMEMKKVQLEEARQTLVALQVGQESSKLRFDFYSKLAGVDVQPLGSTGQPFKAVSVAIDSPSSKSEAHLNSLEMEEEIQAIVAQSWNNDAANLEIMAGILHALPSFNIHGTPFGCGVEIAWGMPNIAAGLQAMARQSQLYASNSSFRSSQAGRKATYIKQYQDRVHQMNMAGLEFEHLNSQIDTQNTRIQITNMDIANQQQIIDNAQEVRDFLTNKYTNEELYSYLEGTLRTAMYQTYTLAYDLAKKAELAFRFERRPTTVQSAVNFVSFGYFNPARDGLQASHQLYLALKSMDAAYQDSRGHDYEITKSISLRQLDPFALLALRETGTCTFDVPEVLFDMDFPGHYFRRIKTVSLTVPCVVGPHAGVNATLRLLRHRYRADARAGSSREYAEDTSSGGLDARFRTAMVPIDAVAASTAQNDSGAFELSLRDERFVPFEGAGAVASWQLVLPPAAFRPFDYSSIADVVLAVRYTACEGGDALRRAAAASVVDWVAGVESESKDTGLLALFDVRAEFAAEWAKLAGPAAPATSDDVRTLVLRGLGNRLPAFVAGRDPAKVRAMDVSLVTTLPLTQAADLAFDFKYGAGGSGDDTPFDSGPSKIGSLYMFRISEADDAIGDWALKVKVGSGIAVSASSRMWVVVRYRLAK